MCDDCMNPLAILDEIDREDAEQRRAIDSAIRDECDTPRPTPPVQSFTRHTELTAPSLISRGGNLRSTKIAGRATR